MTTTKAVHTPGPWVSNNTSVFNSKRKCIAICDTEATKSVEQDRCNARLIAAAPEMLAALQTLLPLSEGMPGLRPAGFLKVADEARAAIAKATGAA